MSHINEYEYENESLIDSTLLCAICLNPFNKPKLTLCGHMFCEYCIRLWYKKSATCPMCRHVSLEKDLKTVKNQTILNKLDQLQVTCLLCQQMGLKRNDFNYHIDNECPKAIVSCQTRFIKCSWKGKREDLEYHRTICSYKSNRSRFMRRIKVNKPQSKLVDSHRSIIENLINQYPMNSKITLRSQQLTDADISMVVQSAIINKRCKILDLGKNQITSYGLLELADSLKNNTTLKVLSLHENSIPEKSIEYLAKSLALNNSFLKWLDLESTDLTDRSAQYLASMLITNTSITGLWLSNNKIGYHGVKMLTSVLISYDINLKYLDLENNQPIDDSCLDCLMDMIKQNQSLKTVYLNRCQLSITSQTKLRDIADKKPHFHLFL